MENFSLHEFDTFSTASLITRTTNDTTQVQQVLIMILRMVISAPMMAIGGLFWLSRRMSHWHGCSLRLCPSLLSPFLVIMRRAIPLFQVMQVKIDKLNLVLDEGLTGVRVIRAFDRNAHEKQAL